MYYLQLPYSDYQPYGNTIEECLSQVMNVRYELGEIGWMIYVRAEGELNGINKVFHCINSAEERVKQTQWEVALDAAIKSGCKLYQRVTDFDNLRWRSEK